MKTVLAAVGLLAASTLASTADAGLWSIDNIVADLGETVTTTVWFTGDRSSVAAELRVRPPVSHTAVAVRSLDPSAFCGISSDASGPTVTFVYISWDWTTAVPQAPQPVCEIDTVAISYWSQSNFFRPVYHACFDVLGNDAPRCAFDPGYVTVVR